MALELRERRLAAVMFTDIVGYTALIQTDESLGIDKRDRYWAALERDHEACGGTIVQRLGDGSMSMFPSALGAVQAAVAIQRELTSADVPVRIGIHVGEVMVEPARLTGEAVNIASRIESFSVAGGVMLSGSAYDQIKSLTELDVVEMGRYRLKNVGRPFELYAISAERLVVPDPQTLAGKGEGAALPTNLPEPAGHLVGRAHDLAVLLELVRGSRVVTITGPGGTGKTRLLVELGRTLTPEFLDGVAFVALADVADPTDFVPALAEALDVKEAKGRTLGEGIVSLLGDRNALLLLDNFEQIVSAAADVARLIERCPGLRVVATSRTPLRGNIEAALEALLEAAEAGDETAREEGLQLCGDLWMYWHMRGKNVTQRRYAHAFLGSEGRGAPTVARVGALLSAGVASWVLGQSDNANDEWAEAYRIASELEADRELCLAGFSWALGLLTSDLPKALALTGESIELSRRLGFTWGEGFALTLDGIVRTGAGDLDAAQRSLSEGLEIQRRIGDEQGAGLSLGGLGQLAADCGALEEALGLYRQSLAAFQANGDRAEEARILSAIASTHLQHGDSTLARQAFLESAQAYQDVASVRGIGRSLIGLAAADASEGRNEEALKIAAAAEVYARQEGIVNVYTEQPVGRDFIDGARAELSPEDVTKATEAGRRLTIKEALDLARGPARFPNRRESMRP